MIDHDISERVSTIPKPSWVVLVVDDEPEVHEVTKLVLANMEFCGIPVELNSAFSAKQAKSFLQDHPNTAVLLLDVVMETDDAGLSLARYIRDELHDEDIQIVLRTGQPGHAPEKSVILNYDINGYFLKTEITAQKLHSIIISSLRNYQYIKNIKQTRHSTTGSRSNMPSDRMVRLIESLRAAIRNDTLNVVAQPQIRLSNNTLVGIHCMPDIVVPGIPRNGLSRLITSINDHELVLQIDKFLLDRACTMTTHWRSSSQGKIRLVVPMFSTSFDIMHSVEMIETCIARTQLDPSRLEIELQDTMMTTEFPIALESVTHLQSIGVHVSIVHSAINMMSLRCLRQINPSRLVIPRLLINDLSNSTETSTVVRSIIALAHTMGMTVVAEGVSTQEELEFLKWEECEIARGSLIAQALPIEESFKLMPPTDMTMIH